MYKLTREELIQAIKEGISDAIWKIATNASDTPCHDFYHAIERGVEKGTESVEGWK